MSEQEDLQAQALRNIGAALGMQVESEQDSLNKPSEDDIELDDVTIEQADDILAEEIALDEIATDPVAQALSEEIPEHITEEIPLQEESKKETKSKKKSLGRGLNSLLGEEDYLSTEEKPLDKLKISNLKAGKYQPRTEFGKEAIDALVESVKEKGVLQPLLVRLSSKGSDKYEIIAGERRWRAAKLAGLTEVPVIIKEFDDKETLEVSLVENLQREDLNPIEEAEGYQKLVEEFSHTQEKIANIVGKSRSYIANTLRLLNLPKSVIKMLGDGKLSAGHAKILVGLDNAFELANLAIEKDLTVRELENIVSEQKNGEEIVVPTKEKPKKDVELVKLEKDLTSFLGYKVKIKNTNKGGKLTLSYKSLEELDDIVQKLESISSYEQDSLNGKKEEITNDDWQDALKPDTGDKPAGEFIPEDM